MNTDMLLNATKKCYINWINWKKNPINFYCALYVLYPECFKLSAWNTCLCGVHLLWLSQETQISRFLSWSFIHYIFIQQSYNIYHKYVNCEQWEQKLCDSNIKLAVWKCNIPLNSIIKCDVIFSFFRKRSVIFLLT